MTKSEIQGAATLKLLAHVFGKKPGQNLQDFAAECRQVSGDEKFIGEVRDYAMSQAIE